MATPVFSNFPRFAQKVLSLNQTLDLPHFNVLTQSALENNSAQGYATLCQDPNMAAQWVKQIVHEVIRVGGKPIDLNFIWDLFYTEPTRVRTKRWFNHYVQDPDLNIFSAGAYTASAPGAAFEFQILPSNHGGSGNYSNMVQGYLLVDKDSQTMYQCLSVDTSIDFAHKPLIQPLNGSVTGSIVPNKPYLVIPARLVGGESCKVIQNSMSSMGFTKEVNPYRVRKDWQLSIDLLRGFLDKFQFAPIYDLEGNPSDAFDLFEAKEMREAIRIACNILAFMGSPTTNQSLISGTGATIDSIYTGFYGILPSVQFGGGQVYPYRASTGFDLESDGEPIFLWQDALKRTKNFLVLLGLKANFDLNNRANRLVEREGTTRLTWEAFRRLGELSGEDYRTQMVKFGVREYDYMGFNLDFKIIDAFSDRRYVGSDFYSGLMLGIPEDGVTENGRPVNPIEFYQTENNGWTGDYEEYYIDQRKQDPGCDLLSGWAAQTIAMGVHGPDLWWMATPAIGV
jgi:hypothetical protein